MGYQCTTFIYYFTVVELFLANDADQYVEIELSP